MNQKTENRKQITDSQAGVTLLMAILILSGLTLTVLATASFTIQEIRSSRAILLSESAIAAAHAVSEEGIWSIKRKTSLIDCALGQTTVSLEANTKVSTCKSFGSATLEVKGSVPYVFYLYDPQDINGDKDLQGCLPCTPPSSNPAGFLYTDITIINKSLIYPIDIYIQRIDGTVVGPQPVTVSPNATQTVTLPAVFPGNEGRMKVSMESVNNVTVELNTNKGMPDFPTVNSIGCKSLTALTDCSANNPEIFTRSLNVTVPQ